VDVLLLASAEVDTQRVRKELQASTFTLSTAFQHDPDSFQVKVVDSLIANDRTGKTSNFVVRELQQ
jgi:hypothetical protein